MPKFLIERDVPGAGELSQAALADLSRKSRCALEHMGPEYHWLHSYVAGDKFFCIHVAPSEQAIREHSRRGGFPVGRIVEVKTVIDPATADL